MLISDVYLNGFFKFSNHGLSEGVRLPFGKPSHPIHVGHHGSFLLSAQKAQKFIEICRDQLKFLFLLEVSIKFCKFALAFVFAYPGFIRLEKIPWFERTFECFKRLLI
jgi:hypothetical protein